MKSNRTLGVEEIHAAPRITCAPPNIAAEREDLARRVADAFHSAFEKLAQHKEDIERLWTEFERLKRGEMIMGCRTKREFCSNVLHRSVRAAQYMLRGGNPVSRRAKRETVSRTVPAVSRKQQRRLLTASAIVAELIAAYEADCDISGYIRELKKCVLDPAELSTIMESETEKQTAGVSHEIEMLAYKLATEVLRANTLPQMHPIAFNLIGLLEGESPAAQIQSHRDDSGSKLRLQEGRSEP